MDNLSFLKEILTTGCEYWIVAKKEYRDQRESLRGPDSIWLIALPIEENFHVARNENEILLKDIERLREVYVQNIAISENYAPFQLGQNMWYFYRGYPIKRHIKKFMIKALELGSKDINDYKALIDGPDETTLVNEEFEEKYLVTVK